MGTDENGYRLPEPEQCKAEHGVREWPYSERCVLREPHLGNEHKDRHGKDFVVGLDYEVWFKLLWNACVDFFEDPDPDNMTAVAEMMHGIAEDQPQMYTVGEKPVGPVFAKYSEDER